MNDLQELLKSATAAIEAAQWEVAGQQFNEARSIRPMTEPKQRLMDNFADNVAPFSG